VGSGVYQLAAEHDARHCPPHLAAREGSPAALGVRHGGGEDGATFEVELDERVGLRFQAQHLQGGYALGRV